ncbi:hypothetical protein [Arthrospiribacter ruber]|uniref:Lipoprotein n=1 Tax=Arthrospiribacter ruber TaxID=2487934 RepID=A0A951J260_9BACT|nr:hypothetical protein [Arthrospiribacter ruber]MBW3469757.1 hypothetical protein [Arthrospiribacter ruber]
MKIRFVILFFMLIGLYSCNTDPMVKSAKKDAERFLKNVRNPQQLIHHPMLEPEGLSTTIALQNKKRNLEGLRDSVNELCGKSSDYSLVNTFKKVGENQKKFIYLEYEYCKQITFIMGYVKQGDKVMLHSIWPMNSEDRPKDLFQKDADWN